MTYTELQNRMQQISDLQATLALLSWDQETYMPSQAASYRSRQVALLSSLVHEKFVAPEVGNALEALRKSDLKEDQKINIQRLTEDYEKEVKLSSDFVKKRSENISKAFQAWVQAREKNNWSPFAEALKPLVDLKREEAEIRGYEHHPYDALLDLYDPGSNMAYLDPLLSDLKEGLLEITQTLEPRYSEDYSFMSAFVPANVQWEWGMKLLKDIGYDFERGRQDKSHHPFTITLSPGDIRITTRIDERDFSNMLWSTIHEGGHALYEQGLPKESHFGMPMGEAAGLSVHESQSRFWENHIGRSHSFWEAYYPNLQKEYGDVFSNIKLDTFYRAINQVQPNLIRTEADELHYHLHIMIRYEIEKELIKGSLEVEDIKALWNQKYSDYLGIEVCSDKEGVLQDVHWAHGSFGYFPTYTLGSLMAAQIMQQLESEEGNMHNALRQKEFSIIINWLDKNIWKWGRSFDAQSFCQNITGKELQVSPFLSYSRQKFGAIYHIK